jgi:hypothetical protein
MEESLKSTLERYIAEIKANPEPASLAKCDEYIAEMEVGYQKKRYEKPEIINHGKMIFPKEIMEQYTSGTNWCFSCTNCNCN